MEKVHHRFSDKFRSHWVKVKFYQQKPKDTAERLKNVRFCEATRKAVLNPILLDKESIACSGAQHAFGWKPLYKNSLLQNCYKKRNIQKNALRSVFSRAPYFKKPFKYIGLNTEGVPDLVMAYVSPQEIMDLIKIYQDKEGGELDVSLSTMMPVCGSIAVRTYMDKKISLSFGCGDSRKFANMRRENLAVGVPRELFNIFVNQGAFTYAENR